MTSSTAPAVTVDTIVALATEAGLDAEVARRVAETMPADKLPEVAASMQSTIDEAVAFRARLAAAPALTRAVCPSPVWRTAADRRGVAQHAVKIIEAFIAGRPQAVAAGITAEQVGEQLVAAEGTVWGSMTLHPNADGEAHDPRVPSWGHSFYGFRFRVTEALDVLLADELRADADRKRAAQDAAWARRGLKRCERCDGQGGRKEWPGFDCYDCGGHGSV